MAGFNLGKARDILKGLASFAWGKVVKKVAGYFVTAGQQIVQKLPEPVADFSKLGLPPESIRTLVALRNKGYNARVTQDQLRALWNDLLKPGAKSSWIYPEEKQTLFARERSLRSIVDQLIQGQPVSVGELTRLLERGGRGIVNPRFPLPRPSKVADTAPASQYPPHLGQPVMGKGWFIRLLPTDLINTIFKPVVWVVKLPVRAVENIAKLPILPLILTRTVESYRWSGMLSFNTIARGAIAATMYATVASAVFNANSEPPQPPSEHPTISQPAAGASFKDAAQGYLRKYNIEKPSSTATPTSSSRTLGMTFRSASGNFGNESSMNIAKKTYSMRPMAMSQDIVSIT